MSELQETEGIVISIRNYRESDRLVKIFTSRLGKRMFFIKGSRKSNSNLKAAILPFTMATYITDIKDTGLGFIRDAKDLTHLNQLHTDIFLNAYATYILSLADVAIEDGIPDSTLFHKVKQLLLEIDNGTDPEILVNIFEVQILPYFGVEPEWRGCRVCGKTTGVFDYSGSYGGLLCQHHWGLDKHRYHASQRAIYFLRLFSIVSMDHLGTIKVKDETKKEIRVVLDMIYDESVGITLKSKRFIDQMYQWGDLLIDRKPEHTDPTK
ncbi:MAG: DNA repair protein RecO [Carnobacterium sp.]